MKTTPTNRGAWLIWLLAGMLAVGVAVPHQHGDAGADHDDHACEHTPDPSDSSPAADADCSICAFLHTIGTSAPSIPPVVAHVLSDCGEVTPVVSLLSERLVRLTVSARAPPARA